MITSNDQALARLRKTYGERWETWIVNCAVGPPVWCARLRADHRCVLNADTTAYLTEYIEDAEAVL